jgi:hypothetical protein
LFVSKFQSKLAVADAAMLADATLVQIADQAYFAEFSVA